MTLRIGIIIPGDGSDNMEDPEVVVSSEGKRYVEGTVYDDQTGGFNMPDGPCLIPFTMSVPVSCILSCDPASEPILRETDLTHLTLVT